MAHPFFDRLEYPWNRQDARDLYVALYRSISSSTHRLPVPGDRQRGSPVLDDAGRLIGLHHAGGRPQEVAGKQPVVKNEGIRIEVVRAGIQAAGIAVP